MMCLLSIAYAFSLYVTVNAAISPALRYVSVGGCYNFENDILVQCAAVEEECDFQTSGLKFRTAKELKALGDHECTTKKLPVGICKSTGQCAITKDSCDDIDDFSSKDLNNAGCNAEGIITNQTFVPTQYGACIHGTTNEITCVLTPADCSDKEAWVSANVAKDRKNGGCRCHDVKVGACVNGPYIDPMLSQCSISVDDCNPLVQSFGTARSVADHPLLDCRLCPYDEALTGEQVEDSEKTSVSSPEDVDKTDLSSPETDPQPVKSDKRGFSGGEITAIAVGSTVCVVLAASSLYKQRKEPTDSQKGTNATSDAEIS
mmetsp:Transcript_1062/g.1531  ORF Transcript_1062/g.1531 Transcript_1062/m.1531 type:complete len:317 (-) Transcript_1062:42-992(-)